MADNEPRVVAGIGNAELLSSEVGDRMAVRIERGPDFRFHAVDDVLFTATQFNELDIAFTRTEPTGYERVVEIQRKDERGAVVEVVGITSTPITVVTSQHRMPYDAAVNMAVSMVRYLATNSESNRARLKAELAEFLSADE